LGRIPGYGNAKARPQGAMKLVHLDDAERPGKIDPSDLGF
jgi:hypothetical protein